MVNVDTLTNKLIAVVIFVFVAAALVPIALSSFTNIAGSGIALAALFSTVLGIVLAAAIFMAVLKGLKL